MSNFNLGNLAFKNKEILQDNIGSKRLIDPDEDIFGSMKFDRDATSSKPMKHTTTLEDRKDIAPQQKEIIRSSQLKNSTLRKMAEENYSSSSSEYEVKREFKDYDKMAKQYRSNQGHPNEFEDDGQDSIRAKINYPPQPRKHFRKIALETGRKAEQKESEDRDQPIKTVYPDSSRLNRATAAGPDESLDTNKTKQILESLGDFSVDILDEALISLEQDQKREIEKIQRKYGKIKAAIHKAIEMKKFM